MKPTVVGLVAVPKRYSRVLMPRTGEIRPSQMSLRVTKSLYVGPESNDGCS